MFKFFKKSHKPIEEYPESWSILNSEDGLFIRINLGYRDAIAHPDYPIKMGVAIPIKDEDDDKTDMKHSMEEALNEIFNKNKGVLVGVITALQGEKFIEFLSYTKGNLDFGSVHQALKDKFPKEDVQMYAEQDSGWDTYKSLLE